MTAVLVLVKQGVEGREIFVSKLFVLVKRGVEGREIFATELFVLVKRDVDDSLSVFKGRFELTSLSELAIAESCNSFDGPPALLCIVRKLRRACDQLLKSR